MKHNSLISICEVSNFERSFKLFATTVKPVYVDHVRWTIMCKYIGLPT